MSITQETRALDPDKLMAFVFRAVGEVGATLNTALVVMGDKLGLYRALAAIQAAYPERACGADRGSGALRPRVAQCPGCRRVCRLRPRQWSLRPAASAGGGPH